MLAFYKDEPVLLCEKFNFCANREGFCVTARYFSDPVTGGDPLETETNPKPDRV